MARTSRPVPRSLVQSRYYHRNRERLLAKARERYQEQKTLKALAKTQAPEEPKTESSESSPEAKKPKSLLGQWIQRLRGVND